MRILCGRPALLGDVITYLPFLTYLEKLYLGSEKIYCLSPQCATIAPLLLGHTLINRLHVTEAHDKWDAGTIALADSCDLVYELNPPITDDLWFNKRDIVEEQFLMNIDLTNKRRYSSDNFRSLSTEDKLPRLYPWFKIEKMPKIIGLFPFAGYDLADETSKKRSLTVGKAEKLAADISKLGYKTAQFGHPKSPRISADLDFRNTSLFGSVRLSLGCDAVIGTDSGSMHILGAYGAPQVILSTNWRQGHTQNFSALIPKNHENSLINIFKPNTIESIQIEEIIQALETLLK